MQRIFFIALPPEDIVATTLAENRTRARKRSDQLKGYEGFSDTKKGALSAPLLE